MKLEYLRNSQLANSDSNLEILGFAEDLDIIGNLLIDIANSLRELKKAAKKSV